MVPTGELRNEERAASKDTSPFIYNANNPPDSALKIPFPQSQLAEGFEPPTL
jgi:hypothetical protein